jgi:inner membrane protein YidH
MPESMERFNAEPSVSNHFSWLRTRLALDRSFMAWIRTSVSLIGFGFTITQFFTRLREMQGGAARPMTVEAPRDLGLTLIAAGVGALAVSAWQYRDGIKYLWSAPFRSIAGVEKSPIRTPVFLAAMVLIAIGMAAFVAVFFHWT